MRKYFNRALHFLPLAVAGFFSLVIAGCGGGGGTSFTSGGSLTVQVTDAPVDGVTAVWIEFTKVRVHSSTNGTLDFTLASPKRINLLSLTDGKSELLLDDQRLPAGQYQWIRLFVDESNSYVVTSAGAEKPLDIPSNAQSDTQSGLKLNRSFTLDAEGTASFVIDFDLRKSLHKPNGVGKNYVLRPTLRIVSATVLGGIEGDVSDALVNNAGCTDLTTSGGIIGGAVYVYDGASVTPDDINLNLSSPQPLSTAMVKQHTPTGGPTTWHYTVAFLEPNKTYTVAFTCHSSLDDPETTDNGVVFNAPSNVPVTSGANTVHNIP